MCPRTSCCPRDSLPETINSNNNVTDTAWNRQYISGAAFALVFHLVAEIKKWQLLFDRSTIDVEYVGRFFIICDSCDSPSVCDLPHGSANPILTLLQATFLRRLPATGGGEMAPRHILSSRAHTDKIPTATPMFLRSNFLLGVLRFCGTPMCARNPGWQPNCRK